jgi:membrane-bound serine protease (ClpP class)
MRFRFVLLWLLISTLGLRFGALAEEPAAEGQPAFAPAADAVPAPALQNAEAAPRDSGGTVYIVPIQSNVTSPLLYLVRRGVKEAMENNADVLILDMETDGGSVAVTRDIIGVLEQFPGETITYVNRSAFSAGAFISLATRKIYMAPQSVIGAAAAVAASPTGGAQDLPSTMELKMDSALSALVRAQAEKNGHNPQVADAMVKKSELVVDGKVLNEKGHILTLTNVEAEQEYGDPPMPLLSSGTVASLDALLDLIGYANARTVFVEPTGAERLGFYINTMAPLLLMIGLIGLYIEFKTPGFGFFGIAGVTAFVIFFLGRYIAGFSGMEWLGIFILGLILIGLEIFVFPGTLISGLTGAVLILVSIVMAMVDMYPGMPPLPTLPQLRLPMQNLAIALFGAMLMAALLSRYLPKSRLFHAMTSQAASGVETVRRQEETFAARSGRVGVTISTLRPGGKAQFGEEIVDVVSQGDLIEKGRQVRIIGHRGTDALVEAAD